MQTCRCSIGSSINTAGLVLTLDRLHAQLLPLPLQVPEPAAVQPGPPEGAAATSLAAAADSSTGGAPSPQRQQQQRQQ
jgi:hypothetical protein